MPKRLPRLNAKEITAVIEKKGFTLVRQSGSYKIYRDKQGKRVTIPFHGSKVLHPKTLKSILVDAEINTEELTKLLK